MDPTTLHAHRAREGDPESLAWLFERFSPWLLAQAKIRLRARISSAEDVVHDVWLRAIPVLGTLQARDGRHTPVLVKFLSTTLLYRVNELHRQHLRGEAQRVSSASLDAIDPGTTRGLLTRVATAEGCQKVLDAIDELPEVDRRIVVLRALEQRPNHDVARDVGLSSNATSLRFNRAVGRLRSRLGPSVLDELADEDDGPTRKPENS